MRLIKKGEVKFTAPIWKRVSADAKALIEKMLVLAPEKRISAQQARLHHWISSNCAKTAPSDKSIGLPLENLRAFHTQHILQTAVLTFMATQLTDGEHEQRLQKMFTVFDTDNDGQISKSELAAGYGALNINSATALSEVEGIFEQVDLNKNEKIDYNGISRGLDWGRIPGGEPEAAADLFGAEPARCLQVL